MRSASALACSAAARACSAWLARLGPGHDGFGVGTALGFGCGIGAGLGFAGSGGGLGFVLRFLFHGHQAGFFGGFGGFFGGGFDGGLVLFLAINFFGVQELLAGFGKNRGGVFVGGGDVRDADRVARFEEFERSLAVDAENCVLNVGVRGGIGAAGYEFVFGVDDFLRRRRRWRSPSPPCCRAESRRNRARR